MSSALLFLAIVAIWALVLVPRWLRPKHVAEAAPEPEVVEAAEAPGAAEPDAEGAPASPAATHAPPRARTRTPTGPGALTDAARRTRVLQARRRTLITLVLLTAGAVAIAFAHLAASWVSIPPAALLVFFLLLLRTAARVDAQRAYEAHLRARAARPATAAAPQAATAAPEPATAAPAASSDRTAGEAEPDAEIIDISVRIEDQPYDQYLDAESRAVGD